MLGRPQKQYSIDLEAILYMWQLLFKTGIILHDKAIIRCTAGQFETKNANEL